MLPTKSPQMRKFRFWKRKWFVEGHPSSWFSLRNTAKCHGKTYEEMDLSLILVLMALVNETLNHALSHNDRMIKSDLFIGLQQSCAISSTDIPRGFLFVCFSKVWKYVFERLFCYAHQSLASGKSEAFQICKKSRVVTPNVLHCDLSEDRSNTFQNL